MGNYDKGGDRGRSGGFGGGRREGGRPSFSSKSWGEYCFVPAKVPAFALLFQFERVCIEMPSCLADSDTLPWFSSMAFMASALNSAV